MGIPFLGGIRWIIPSQIRVKSPSDNFCHGKVFFLASFFKLVLLTFGNVNVNSFFGHLSQSFLTCTDIMLYNTSISERKEQVTCWSTSTNCMEAKSNSKPSKRLSVPFNSSEPS